MRRYERKNLILKVGEGNVSHLAGAEVRWQIGKLQLMAAVPGKQAAGQIVQLMNISGVRIFLQKAQKPFRKDPVAVADAYGGAVAFEVFSASTLGETGAQEPCRPVGDGKIGRVLVQAVQDRGAFFDEEQSPVRQAVCEEEQIAPFPGGGIEGFPDAAG